MMKLKNTLLAATALSAVSALGVQADVITVATVNNGDMIRMQGLTDDFTDGQVGCGGPMGRPS